MENQQDIYDPRFVKSVFDRCSRRYIAFSFLLSFGFTERWRRQCVAAAPTGIQQDARIYDLMAGTGEVWPHLIKRYPNLSQITAIDISSGMHEHALQRLHTHRSHRINFIEDDVLNSALETNSADLLISTFGLKTFNATQHQALAKLIAATLKPGGAFSLIEASDPKGWVFRPLYMLHLKRVLPLIERLFLKGAQDFTMIGTYSSNFGDAQAFAKMLRAEGLEVHFKKYFFGCATGVAGTKPSLPN